MDNRALSKKKGHQNPNMLAQIRFLMALDAEPAYIVEIMQGRHNHLDGPTVMAGIFKCAALDAVAQRQAAHCRLLT